MQPRRNATTLLRSARTAWAISPLGPGVEPVHETPSTVLYEKPHALVRRIAPAAAQSGNPVLLVTPLAVPVSCWDLRPGQSLAAHLASTRPTYTIDYGDITFADRAMGFEHWVDGILPEAVRRIADEHDAPVHLVGWSLGASMSLMLGAHLPNLPIASITGLAAPIDYRRTGTYAPLFAVGDTVGLTPLLATTKLAGGAPAVATRLAYRWLSPMRELTKPWTLLTNLDQPETLARIEATDRFTSSMPGYPARLLNQSIAVLTHGRAFMHGEVRLTDDLTIRTRDLALPTLLIGSTSDAIAHADSVRAGLEAFPKAKVEFIEVDGFSHLGIVASPRASEVVWPALDRHLAATDRA
ncbi:MAG: alpha/beta hydrolase [Aeromicrobium sp.]|uniref:alpha/beta hydrolase n=1 Tax=Aeromicrobium sp. TaxID=1871063 RepID=UPI0039E4558A